MNCLQADSDNDHPIPCKDGEAAVQLLKKGNSAGVDNIPAELVQAGGKAVFTALKTICNKILQTEWPTLWAQSLLITLPKKGNLQQYQNYQMIGLISHPPRVMLKIILKRLKPQVEKIMDEEQAGLRAGKSTTEQIFNLRILCEKHQQVCLLVSWYFEPSQPQRIISGLKTNFRLSPIYSTHKSTNHKLSEIYKITPDTNSY